MGFFDGIKKFKNQINRLDDAITSGGGSILEVYERNAKLEAEIASRTWELDRANKQMLTLRHIWDMMNSSKPLSSVLNAIVNSLQGELGYLYSFIVKQRTDNDGSYLQIAASSTGSSETWFSKYFNCETTDFRLNFPDISGIKQAIKENQIYQSEDISELVRQFIPNLDKDKIHSFINETKIRSYILVPLVSKQTHFGSLFVFSSRKSVSGSELNFLKLFAKQIELAITIADLFQAVKEQAVTDGMTGLYNRRYFEEFIKKEAVRSERQNQKFTIIGIDLDHLKRINDKYGHSCGDTAIKAIAEVLKNNARSVDVAARIGGEEFDVVLPGIDSAGGCIAAERIRKAIASINLETVGNITASLGVATYLEHSEDLDELLEITDRAMYDSKKNGRNRVTIARPANETTWQEIAIDTFVDILAKHRIPVDKKTSKLLAQKLQQVNTGNDRIYQVADALIETYNPEHTSGSAKQKVQLASLLAKRFDLPKENIDKLKIAVLLYDIGNTMLPKELLRKKEPLSEEDKISIKQHPVIAAREILEPISNITDIIPIIEKHHENWDGTGYPERISGEEIPIESQIILIIDSYFALLENRPYREAMNQEDAIKLIDSETGTKWSEKLAKEFIGIVRDN